jgi:hypothetical protein
MAFFILLCASTVAGFEGFNSPRALSPYHREDRRSRVVMMPLGVPRVCGLVGRFPLKHIFHDSFSHHIQVPYRVSGDHTDWIDVYSGLAHDRILFLGQVT